MTNQSSDDSSANFSKRATTAAHEAVDRASEKAAQAEEHLRETADEVRARSKQARERAKAWGDEASVTARSYVREHPFASLAMVFGAGMVISALMRR